MSSSTPFEKPQFIGAGGSASHVRLSVFQRKGPAFIGRTDLLSSPAVFEARQSSVRRLAESRNRNQGGGFFGRLKSLFSRNSAPTETSRTAASVSRRHGPRPKLGLLRVCDPSPAARSGPTTTSMLSGSLSSSPSLSGSRLPSFIRSGPQPSTSAFQKASSSPAFGFSPPRASASTSLYASGTGTGSGGSLHGLLMSGSPSQSRQAHDEVVRMCRVVSSSESTLVGAEEDDASRVVEFFTGSLDGRIIFWRMVPSCEDEDDFEDSSVVGGDADPFRRDPSSGQQFVMEGYSVMEPEGFRVTDFAFDPQSQILVAGFENGAVYRFQQPKRTGADIDDFWWQPHPVRNLEEQQEITAVDVFAGADDEIAIVVGTKQGLRKVVNLQTGKVSSSLRNTSIHCLAHSDVVCFVGDGGKGDEIMYWNIRLDRPLHRVLSPNPIRGKCKHFMHFHPTDSRHCIVGAGKGVSYYDRRKPDEPFMRTVLGRSRLTDLQPYDDQSFLTVATDGNVRLHHYFQDEAHITQNAAVEDHPVPNQSASNRDFLGCVISTQPVCIPKPMPIKERMKEDEIEGWVEDEKGLWTVTVEAGAMTLGKGNFGVVKKGRLVYSCRPSEVIDVAVKKIYIPASSNPKDAQHEFELMQQFSHPNVLSCLGFRLVEAGDSNEAWIVMPLCQGTLKDWIEDDENRFCSLQSRLEILLQVAQGMHELHRNEYVHFDLKPENVLYQIEEEQEKEGESIERSRETSTVVWKITDFGLSRRYGSGGSATFERFRGTAVYIPPPIRKAHPGHDDYVARDVYSFGILFWETLMHRRAFESTKWWGPVEFLSWAHDPTNPKRPPWDEFQSSNGPSGEALIRLVEECWNADPDIRPSFERILARLRVIVETIEGSFEVS